MNLKQQHKEILKHNQEGILISIFKMCDINKTENTPYQFNFYKNKKTNSFQFTTKVEQIYKNEDTLKDKEPKELDLNKIKLEYHQLETEPILTQYNERINKIIILIENNQYNLTYITSSMNMINIKVNPETGEVIKHSKTSILSLKKD